MAVEITNEIISQAEELARRGFNISLIADTLGIGNSTTRHNKTLRTAIKKGHSEARKKVINDLMTRSEADVSATASIYLSKQLKVFDTYFPTSKPKSISEALSKIGNIYLSVSHNELDAEKGDRLIKYLEAYIKGFEASEIERRLSALENKG